MSEIFIAGCGYVGTRLVHALRTHQPDMRIDALVRSNGSKTALDAMSVKTQLIDLDGNEVISLPDLGGRMLYYFIPPPAEGEIDPRIEKFLNALDADRLPARIVLISTTGIYGDCAGAWVEESRPAAPVAARAMRRRAAERVAQDISRKYNLPLVILRVPGIYGPHKLPMDRIRAARPVLAERDSPYSNRVHVDDLVASLIAAASRPEDAVAIGGYVVNISDGNPTSMTDYFYTLADVAGLLRPPAISMHEARKSMGSGMLSYLAESKRLDISRMREVLGVSPRYSDLRAGITASLQEMGEMAEGQT